MHNGLATQLNKHHRNIVVHNSCEICGNGVDSVNHALTQCLHARQLRSAMKQIWVLPDEEQLLSFGPQNLLVFLMDLEGDMQARFLLLFWRTWHVWNNITHDSEKVPFDGSIRFLSRYEKELCMIRHSSDVADLHGKQPVTDSLFAGSRADSSVSVRTTKAMDKFTWPQLFRFSVDHLSSKL
jgi:hypothetical protein